MCQMLSASICYDATDLALAADLKNNSDAFKYQSVVRYSDDEVWMFSDYRFNNHGKSMPFYKAYLEDSRKRKEDGRDADSKVGDRSHEDFVRNDLCADDVLEYKSRIEQGREHIVVATFGMYDRLAPTYKTPLQFDSEEWPSIEHLILASRCSDKSARSRIHDARNVTEARKIASKLPIAEDWAGRCYDILRRAYQIRFSQDFYAAAKLMSTRPFFIRYHGNKDWVPRGGGQFLERVLTEFRSELWARYDETGVAGLLHWDE